MPISAQNIVKFIVLACLAVLKICTQLPIAFLKLYLQKVALYHKEMEGYFIVLIRLTSPPEAFHWQNESFLFVTANTSCP